MANQFTKGQVVEAIGIVVAAIMVLTICVIASVTSAPQSFWGDIFCHSVWLVAFGYITTGWYNLIKEKLNGSGSEDFTEKW